MAGSRLRRPCCVGCSDFGVCCRNRASPAQHTDAVREKSAAENKSRRLTERLATAEAEKGDLRRQLVEERRDANKAIADAQAAQAKAKLVRAEASLARQRAKELEARLNSMHNRVDKTEASTRAEVERTHA